MDPASHNRQQGQFQRKGEQHLQDDIPRGVHDILADDGVRKLAGKDEGRYHQITDQQVLAPRMEIRPGTLVVETGYRHRDISSSRSRNMYLPTMNRVCAYM